MSVEYFLLDDDTLGGSDSQFSEDFKLIRENMKRIGLEINPTKCELFLVNYASEKSMEAVKKIRESVSWN